MDEFIVVIHIEHVVWVITDNATNYMAIGRVLMKRHPTLFWIPCAMHYIDFMMEDIKKIYLMMEDIKKIYFVEKVIGEAKRITRFIYNHALVLSLMRTCTKK
jgi:hypothetical protein